jgi:hypothetical protein
VKLIDWVGIVGSLGILATVVALAATGRLKPRYALLWLVSAGGLVLFSVWREGIDVVARAFGVVYAPALLFLGAGVLFLLILLHMSVVVSRLTDRTRRLAQDLALLRAEVEARRELEGRRGPG